MRVTYAIQNVARTKPHYLALETKIAKKLPQDEYYFEYFGPDLKLPFSSPNMTNQKHQTTWWNQVSTKQYFLQLTLSNETDKPEPK